MSELDALLFDADFATATVLKERQEPPKRWRNWWDYTLATCCTHCGRMIGPGPAPTCFAYASKDVAETHAREVQARNETLPGGAAWTYIGTFPEGQRP